MESTVSTCIQSKPIARREFYLRAMYGLGTLIALGITAPATIYVFGSPSTKRETGWMDAGAIGTLRVGAPVELPIFRIHRDGWKIRTEQDSVWVIRHPDGLTAFSPRCTHLGCAYHFDSAKQRFVCPCHGSLFSLSGEVMAGPAPRPLDRLPTRIDGDRLWVGGREV